MAKGNNKNCGGSGGEEKKEDNGGGGGSGCAAIINIVLKVDLHCEGCTKKIRKLIHNFPGVMSVEFEEDTKVKVMAKKEVEPMKLREFIQKKTLKKTELISPQPPKKDDKKKEEKKEEKPKELPVTTVMLKVSYHCDGCGQRLHRVISSYQGVHEVSIEKEKDRVKVTGRIEAKKLVEEIQKRLKKRVEIVNDKKDKEKEKEKKEGGGGDNKGNGEGGGSTGGDKKIELEYIINGSGYVGICDGLGRVVEIFEAPQCFSDENPNACSVM